MFFLYAKVTILSFTSFTTSLRRAKLTLANVEQNRNTRLIHCLSTLDVPYRLNWKNRTPPT